MPEGLTANPQSLSNTSDQQYKLGGLYYHQGAYYRYVKFLDAVTYGEGHVVEWASDFRSVTNDRSGGSSIGRCPAGICLCAMTQNYYGFIQVAGMGKHQIYTDEGVAAGDYLVSHTVDGEADTMADGEEEQVFAFSIAADSGSYVASSSWYFKGLL